MSTAPAKKKKKSWLIAIVIIASLAIVGYVFKWNIYVQYYNLTKNHFKPGDKVYADPSFFKEKRKYSIALWRVLKPIADSIKNEKPFATLKSNTTVVNYKLFDEKSGLIGTYLFHDVLDIKTDNNKIVFTNFYAIKPNLKVCDTKVFDYFKLPDGYQWADSTIYVIATDVTDKESFK